MGLLDLPVNIAYVGLASGVLILSLFTIGIIFTRLYVRASKETSFVRTGLGGQRVVMNGGAIVLPVLHETIKVNMNTLRLEVKRANEQALITKDRMRVDVQAEFYVRVKPTEDAIADAAQTLGQKTMHPTQLKELVEGKFVDALRSVAAEMAMEELHEQRVDFVQKVQRAVSEDLLKNGLELETVSLTGLDQTSREYFNPDNAFDAQGLTKLTEEIEQRRKQRNEIEQDTQVAIQKKNLEAERMKLELAKEEEYAKLKQHQEIAVRKASQAAEIKREEAEKQKEALQAEIAAKQQVDMSSISAERTVQEGKIEMERQLREKEIEKSRAIEVADVERQKMIELAKQEQAIAIAEKSRAQSEAQAEADRARAVAVQAEEQVVTVRETEVANRQKAIELVEAAKKAERDAIAITVAAQAEKHASQDKGAATTILAQAEAERLRVEAQGKAEAEKLTADAAATRYAVEAEGKRAINEASNLLSPEQIAMQVKLAIVRNLAEIIRESVKPLERIEGIKIYQVDGLGGGSAHHAGGGDGSGGASAGGGNLSEQVVNSALKYRAQAPLLDSLMREIGLSAGDVSGLTKGLKGSLDEEIHVNGSASTNGAGK